MDKMERVTKFLFGAFLILIFIGALSYRTMTSSRTGKTVEITETVKGIITLKENFKVGEIAIVDDLSMKVNSMRFVDEIDTDIGEVFYQPREGNRFLILDVTIENVGEDATRVNPLHMTVVDANSYTYNLDGGTFYLSRPLEATMLEPKNKANGMVAFQILKGEEPMEFVYDDIVHEAITINLVE